VQTEGPGERNTLERLAADEATLEREITAARRDAAATIERSRQEAERIAAEARAEAERELARLRAEAAAEADRALAERRAEAEAATAELPRRAGANRARAIARAFDVVLGRAR
jgi:vacuolar-type H+-ATPase subunit H